MRIECQNTSPILSYKMQNTTPSIRLRSDEYNKYIQDYKEQCIFDEKKVISPQEAQVVTRCCMDYGLTQKNPKTIGESQSNKDNSFSLVLFIKGDFTLPNEVSFASDRGVLKLRPYIIHDTVMARRMRIVAHILFETEELSSPFPMDEEYIYESLQETAFTLALEEVEKWGKGAQSLQITFDENGHFKTVDLD